AGESAELTSSFGRQSSSTSITANRRALSSKSQTAALWASVQARDSAAHQAAQSGRSPNWVGLGGGGGNPTRMSASRKASQFEQSDSRSPHSSQNGLSSSRAASSRRSRSRSASARFEKTASGTRTGPLSSSVCG